MSYLYIEAPSDIVPPQDKEIIFLAGGITRCCNWQARATEVLANLPVVICNPRRRVWNLDIEWQVQQQILWEFKHLELATQILFWFEKDEIQPIALFELGARLRGNKPIFLGVHPDYPRRIDILTQAPLYRYTSKIEDDLESLIKRVTDYNRLLNIVVKK